MKVRYKMTLIINVVTLLREISPINIYKCKNVFNFFLLGFIVFYLKITPICVNSKKVRYSVTKL